MTHLSSKYLAMNSSKPVLNFTSKTSKIVDKSIVDEDTIELIKWNCTESKPIVYLDYGHTNRVFIIDDLVQISPFGSELNANVRFCNSDDQLIRRECSYSRYNLHVRLHLLTMLVNRINCNDIAIDHIGKSNVMVLVVHSQPGLFKYSNELNKRMKELQSLYSKTIPIEVLMIDTHISDNQCTRQTYNYINLTFSNKHDIGRYLPLYCTPPAVPHSYLVEATAPLNIKIYREFGNNASAYKLNNCTWCVTLYGKHKGHSIIYLGSDSFTIKCIKMDTIATPSIKLVYNTFSTSLNDRGCINFGTLDQNQITGLMLYSAQCINKQLAYELSRNLSLMNEDKMLVTPPLVQHYNRMKRILVGPKAAQFNEHMLSVTRNRKCC